MNTEYICNNADCGYHDGPHYKLDLPSELIMDDKNLAALFCPYCKNELVPASQLKKVS